MTAVEQEEDSTISNNNNDNGGYWDMDEPVKKTISTASLTGFNRKTQEVAADNPVVADDRNDNDQQNEESIPSERKKGGNYWDWDESVLKKTLSSLSLGQLVGGGRNNSLNKETTTSSEEKPKNYWNWRNSFQSFSDFKVAAEGETIENSDQKPNYWFWRNSSFKSFSTLNLENLDEDNNDSTSLQSQQNEQSPKLEHKLRSSWRKSFQHLSSNSLKRLDENTSNNESETSTWRSTFRSFRDSFVNLQHGEDSEEATAEIVVEKVDEIDEKSLIVTSGSSDTAEEEDGITF
mmetsp:Transcript_17515/g.19531  ORF Transcript_17515/g.19531 Transcript_17515/m.19531 type:complete len:291 (-) Transcript_17515:107-979(-)